METERKFLIQEMPDLSNLKPIHYERYYLYRDGTIEIRVHRKGGQYELIRKEMVSDLSATKEKLVITAAEFDHLKQFGAGPILRDGYNLSSNPDISIKIYHGKHEGLKKVEVEFNSEHEAESFVIPKWFGREITTSPVSRDSKLLDISGDELKEYLQ